MLVTAVAPMMRGVATTIGLTVTLAGCSFQSSGVSVNNDAPAQVIDAPAQAFDAPSHGVDAQNSMIDAAPTIHPDGPHVTPIDARPPDATTIITTPDAMGAASTDSQIAPASGGCHVSDHDLIMCADFETNPISSPIDDGLSEKIGEANVTSTTRTKADFSMENAAATSGVFQSGMVIPETGDLDINDTMTIELWAFMTTLPVGVPDYGLVNNVSQYSVRIDANGTVVCTFQGNGTNGGNNTFFTAATTNTLSILSWHHIACTYDGTNIRGYIDGALVTAATGPSEIATNGDVGTAIGSDMSGSGSVKNRLNGAIDNVRIWHRALSPADVCVAAAISPCP